MRNRFWAISLLLALLAGPLAVAGQEEAPPEPQEAPEETAPPAESETDIDVDVTERETTTETTTSEPAVWYANPFWMTAGAMAVVVVVVLLIAAGRSGGPTVIKTE
jgi:anti-sigma-K factor RskA